MGVSVAGETGLSMRSVKSLLVVFGVLLAFGVYFYGPPITPAVRTAANQTCNEYAGGNYRSYDLEWVSGPGNTPHWSCWDRRRPEVSPISLGWWVDPFH